MLRFNVAKSLIIKLSYMLRFILRESAGVRATKRRKLLQLLCITPI
jgi:hypothetical protein